MSGRKISVLVMGASYGLLPAMRIALAGHPVTIICRADECDAIARSGINVTLPERGGGRDITLTCPARRGAGMAGTIGLMTPAEARPERADIIILAMQEPQMAAPEIAGLARRIGDGGVPVLSLQNMPPPPYLGRIGLDPTAYSGAYSAPDVWARLDPRLLSLASPDAQAVRPDPADPGALTITLATNFKAAPFADPAAQALLSRLSADIDAARPGGHHPSVRLVATSDLFTPLAKWPMLICGNCRCLRDDLPPVSIAEAVHSDPDAARRIYDWVLDLARRLGAPEGVLVPFERYAGVAHGLTLPSSLGRGLAAGATAVERIDLLLADIAREVGIDPAPLGPITARIEAQLARPDRQAARARA